MVSLLTHTNQLHLPDALLQLGPCAVVFDLRNPNSRFADQRFQNLCLEVPPEQLAIFLEQDAKTPSRHPFVKGSIGQQYIQVKADTSNPQFPWNRLIRGTLCTVIVTPRPWVMEGKAGTVLSVQNWRIVEAEKNSLCDFI